MRFLLWGGARSRQDFVHRGYFFRGCKTLSRSNEYRYRDTSTDSMGAFVLRDVLPGEYTLVAWEEVEPEAWLDSDFLKDHEKRGTRITIRLGLATTQDLQVIPAR